MRLTFDPAKDASNQKKHGVSLARFAEMEFERALSARDDAHSDDEERWIFIGPIDGRLMVGVVTYREEDTRVISLRPASRSERSSYGKTSAQSRPG